MGFPPAPRSQSVRHSPYISLNMLGEYLDASPVRQNSILRLMKFPKPSIGAQFRPAEQAVMRYLAGGGGGSERLAEIIDRLLTGEEKMKSTWYKRRNQLSSQAAECLLKMEADLKLDGLAVSMGGNRGHRMDVAGVTISVIPDLIVRSQAEGGTIIGALKFRYVKTRACSQKWADYSSTTLHQFVEEYLAESDDPAQRAHCRIVDVFDGRVHVAPVSYKKRRADVEAACFQIKNLWDSITPGGV